MIKNGIIETFVIVKESKITNSCLSASPKSVNEMPF